MMNASKTLQRANRLFPALLRSFSSAPNVRLPNTGAMINNEWVTGSAQFETFNPANEELIASVTNSGEAELEAAVSAAHGAFYGGAYSQLSGYERGMLLNRLANLIEENKEELALLECLDNGKVLGEAMGADLPLTIQTYRYYAGWADKITGSVVHAGGPIAKGLMGTIEKEPVGIVGQVIPWNFPLLMQAWKLAPAIAAGCSVVLKSAPQTPLTANRVGELIIEAGFPPGAINILPGEDKTGELIVKHPTFDKIAFTGSTGVGHKIAVEAAQARRMKRVTLELGGKSPMVVCNDANVDAAVGIAQVGLFLNQGQCCCASSRIYVEDGVYDEFVEKSAKAAEQRQVSAGWEDGAAQGPQVSKEQFDSVMSYINKGKNDGAQLMTGGNRVGDKGYFVAPTVFAGVTDDMTIAKEEIFGPVMSIMKFSEVDDVIARANNSDYGLAAAVMTRNFTKAQGIAKQLRAGTVWVNCYDTFDAALPFGGFKSSGIGRELGEAGLQSYQEYKTVVWGDFN